MSSSATAERSGGCALGDQGQHVVGGNRIKACHEPPLEQLARGAGRKFRPEADCDNHHSRAAEIAIKQFTTVRRPHGLDVQDASLGRCRPSRRPGTAIPDGDPCARSLRVEDRDREGRTVAADNHHWHIVPDDDGVDQFGDSVETWGSNGGLPFANARNNKYLQVFPDSPNGGQNKNAANLVGTDAFLTYRVQINAPGTYRLWLRWGGYDGSSDSMYAEIVELNDLIEEITGERPRFYRAPFGVNTDYSKELIELLFEQPYCKTAILVERGIAKRQTAAEYLKELEKTGILQSKQAGREVLYLNTRLFNLLSGN